MPSRESHSRSRPRDTLPPTRPPLAEEGQRTTDMTKTFSAFRYGIAAALIGLSAVSQLAAQHKPIRVLVWDERQPKQAEAYDNFLGNELAAYLKTQPGLEVRSAGLDDPDQGITAKGLDETDVLIWWGHVRHGEVSQQVTRDIVERIKAGKLAFIPLHSAHWSNPFIEAMAERTRADARRRYPDPQTKFEFVPMPGRMAPTYDSMVTPAYYAFKGGGGVRQVRVDMPNCVFPGVRADGSPSKVTTLQPGHPIAKGIPATFEIPQSEMYDEPFHVPDPDVVIFQENWATGGWFRGGMLWTVGEGKVFYFRPGHESYPVFKQKYPLKIVENAVRWMAGK